MVIFDFPDRNQFNYVVCKYEDEKSIKMFTPIKCYTL